MLRLLAVCTMYGYSATELVEDVMNMDDEIIVKRNLDRVMNFCTVVWLDSIEFPVGNVLIGGIKYQPSVSLKIDLDKSSDGGDDPVFFDAGTGVSFHFLATVVIRGRW